MPPLSSDPVLHRHGAVVVGGGPAGVAAALALAKICRWTDVTLVERHPELTWTDPVLAYTIGVSFRGQSTLELLGVGEAVREESVEIKRFEANFISRDGKVSSFRSSTAKGFDPPVVYQLSRARLVTQLAKGLGDYNNEAKDPKLKVRVLTSSRVVRMERAQVSGEQNWRIRVVIRREIGERGGWEREGDEKEEGQEEEVVLYPSLVLGCDGTNSFLRKTLQAWAEEDRGRDEQRAVSGEVSKLRGPTFRLNLYPSPAAGLRFKVLQGISANPVTRAGVVMPNPKAFLIAGSLKGSRINLILSPQKQPTAERPALVILRADHPLWKLPLGDVAAYWAAFEEAFPQIDLKAQVRADAMVAFARSPGGVFPVPQASDGVSFVVNGEGPGGQLSPERTNGSSYRAVPGSCAVVILGDAAHAFPPDSGQGVNGALADVAALVRCLEQHDDDVAGAARAFGVSQAPEADCLARLAAIALPHSYQLSPIWALLLWQTNYLARKFLTGALGDGFMAPPVASMLQMPGLKYHEIWNREKEAGRRMLILLISAALALCALVVKLVL